MTENIFVTIDIFSSVSYRSYLQAIADLWTAQGQSMQALAKLLGFSSPNFVQQLIAGKRALTESAAEKVALGLMLKEAERQYLLLLVRLTRTKDADEINRLMNSMKRMVGRARRQSVADTSIFDHWLYAVVFEMFKLKDLKTSEDLLAADLRIGATSQQLQQAFDFLVQRGYLKEKKGQWAPAEVEFQQQNDVRRINGQQNHLKYLTLAQHRINDELADREFQGLTFAVSDKRLPELKERIRSFIHDINEEFAEDTGGDQVLRLQLALFKMLR